MTDPTASDDFADSELGTAPEATILDTEAGWTNLLNYLTTARGFDFHGYKQATLGRRIRKRMAALEIDSFAAYQDHLEVHPDEFTTLFNTILINVTGFFRDPQAWEWLRNEVVPRIVAAKAPGEPIRAWSAGCASGEEAYTLAMVLAEELGADQYRERVKIYATDVDEDGLERGTPSRLHRPRQVESVPPDLLETLLRTPRRHVRIPQGLPTLRSSSAATTSCRRADFAGRSAGVPQHPHVFQLGSAGSDPQPVPLRAE